MSFLWKWKRSTKNSADNSNKVEVNVENNQIYSTLLENTKSLSKIDIKLENIEKNYVDVKKDVDELKKDMIFVKWELEKIQIKRGTK